MKSPSSASYNISEVKGWAFKFASPDRTSNFPDSTK